MGKDSDFKNKFQIKDSKVFDKEKMPENEYYNPDLVLETKRDIIVLEDSSTGDRKVHIGELTQFIWFANQIKTDKGLNMILFLHGESDSAPTPEREKGRLIYYLHNLFSDKLEYINFIGVCKWNEDINGLCLEEIKKLSKCVYERK